MKAKEVISLITADGWYEVNQRGSHKQYKHPNKKGKVTFPVHNGDLDPKTAKSILKQAGLK